METTDTTKTITQQVKDQLSDITKLIDDKTLQRFYQVVVSGRIPYKQDALNDTNAEYDHKNKIDIVNNYVDANLISSKKTGTSMHLPVIDMDYDVFLVPSSPGKNHLLINKPISEESYKKLLDVLIEIGLIQKGIGNQFKNHKATFIRKFQITKTNLAISNVDKKDGVDLFRAYKILTLIKQVNEKVITSKDVLIKEQQKQILQLKEELGKLQNG